MKLLLMAGLILGTIGLAGAAQAHNRDRVKFVCDENGCSVNAVKHSHHHHSSQKTKIKFIGNVCRYKPVTNVTVCRY